MSGFSLRFAALMLFLPLLQGCAERQVQIHCDIQETSPGGKLVKITGSIIKSPDSVTEAQDFTGFLQIVGDRAGQRFETHGTFHVYSGARKFELVAFAQGQDGKIDITVMPDNETLKERGITAVVMRFQQTVADGTPAVAKCQTSKR